MMYSICLVFVVDVTYASQLFDDVLKTFTMIESSEALNVFQNEYLWSIVCNVVKDILENKSSAFLVLKTLLLSSC